MGVDVLHVINRITPTGGAEVSLVQMLPLLVERCGRQAVLGLHPSTDTLAVSRLRAHGVVVYESDAARFPAAYKVVRRSIRAFRPDVVHSTLWEADRAARPAARSLAIPIITGVVNVPRRDEGMSMVMARKVGVLRVVDRAMSRHLTAGFHALTEAARHHVMSADGIAGDRVKVVPRGRDRLLLGEPSPARRARVRRSLGLSDTTPVLLNVGRQERQKGQVLLLQAFSSVLKQVPDAQLLIAGRAGAATADITTHVDVLGLQKSVRLLGPRQDVPDLLAAADAFAFSSLWEGLGGAVLEAMALEVPVVAFDVPAVVEVLGGTGTTVAAGDTRAFAGALVAVFATPTVARQSALLARERFDEHYEIVGVVDAMTQLYEWASRRGRGGA